MEVYKEKIEEYISISDSEGSDPGDDDSDMDPDYCFLEETHEKLSQLSIKKKSKSRCSSTVKHQEEMNSKSRCSSTVKDQEEMKSKSRSSSTVKDQEEMKENVNDFELVYKIIENGEVEKLKLEQCKVYLRKNGLRLTGIKSTLIQRIKEHLQISNGEGEKKYPVSSFVLNCKGDACTGDVVMFEQNVYEMFNIASRSASGPPCGKRIVAGRIVKESYGAAKQQHTFTIEVLWSKGEKPLPPLHPLLIKGRNLYRLETRRQRWEDEGERRKVLMEKHARGSHARSDRETRICEKEMRKQHKANRYPPYLVLVLTKCAKHTLHCTLSKSRSYHACYCCLGFRVTMEGPIRNQPQLNVSQVSQHQRDENFHANHRNHRPPLYAATGYMQPSISFDNYQPPRSLCTNVFHPTNPSQRQVVYQQGRQQLCHFYPQGRCFRGDNCRFLHEIRQESDRTQDHGHTGRLENAGIRRL
ncbi:hypothetical protein LWI29_008892 [Acer saccharum]|uniref:Zinc finger CCCH domain-containing protein 62 n=1 Tax=Acer saccharum TaxID=4024 RepID=A0AA39SBU0_ACESA|nr:hypothetical protein LWI29_008892 [Acer saccharum]